MFAAPLLLLSLVSDWTLFAPSGDPSGAGDVLVVADDGSQVTPPGLAGVVLRDIEFVGRTELERFLSNRPRREVLGATGTRLVLPQQSGSLYAFERAEDVGSTFGYFHLALDGTAAVIAELPGIGPSRDVDPWLPKMACAPAGNSILLASTPDAGGRLLEVDVDTGTTIERTPVGPPRQWQLNGLTLQSDWGAALDNQGAWRFDRASTFPSTAVIDPSTPTFVGDALVLDPTGIVASYFAGSAPDALRLRTFSSNGQAVVAEMPEQDLDGAGFLPEHASGPWIAVAPGGQRVAYRTRELKPSGAPTREVWTASVQSPSPPGHLTSDAAFIDTIDEVGLIRFVIGGDLLFAAGEPAEGGAGLDNLDVYLSSASGGPTQNVTLSSGDPVEPFGVPAQISPEDGLYLVPGTSQVLLHDSQSGSGALRLAGTQPGASATLVPSVKSLDAITWTGSTFVLSVRRDANEDRRQLIAIGPVAGIQQLADVADGIEFTALTSGPDGDVGLIVRAGVSEFVARVDPAAGTAALLWPAPANWVDQLAWSASSLRCTLDPTLVPGIHVDWTAAGGLSLAPTSIANAILLPAH